MYLAEHKLSSPIIEKAVQLAKKTERFSRMEPANHVTSLLKQTRLKQSASKLFVSQMKSCKTTAVASHAKNTPRHTTVSNKLTKST